MLSQTGRLPPELLPTAAVRAARAPSPACPCAWHTRSGALLERVESRAYSERYIARLVRDVLRFIAQCHAKGIVYRDVKPGACRVRDRDRE